MSIRVHLNGKRSPSTAGKQIGSSLRSCSELVCGIGVRR